MLGQLSDREQSEANLRALPVARLTQVLIQIAHGFSGAKGQPPKLEVKDFLPYPNWNPAGGQADGPSPPTRFILTELGKRRALPMHVFAALMTPADRQP